MSPWRILLVLVLISVCTPFVRGSESAPLFREVAAETGLLFQHFIGATGSFYMPEIMGSGTALFDFDGDGDLDVYFLQGRVLDETKELSDSLFPVEAGFRRGNRLFRNELIPSGYLHFVDVTEQAGVGHDGYGMGAAVGDYDNDGDLDMYVTNVGSNVLFRNNGDGSFADITAEAGVDDERWSTSAAFVDYDRDGDLDLFLTNYVDFTVRGNKTCYTPTGEVDYCTPAAYRGLPDRLFRNEGGGRFTDRTEASGLLADHGPGLGVTCADFNGDGLIDIYVANDGTANLLWTNLGDGSFVEDALMSGVAFNVDGTPQGGMGVAAGDVDSDGDNDLLITNLTGEGIVLYRNEGDGLFLDATLEMGLVKPSFLFTGFGTSFFDYDNDGALDLFVVNGAVTIVSGLQASSYPYNQPNKLFQNEGTGIFRERTEEAGLVLEQSEVSRGAAFGDIDNDGDTDIVVSNNNGWARLLLNQVGSRSSWLKLRLQGIRDNRSGLGASVVLRTKEGKTLRRHLHTDGSYLSAAEASVHFGLGTTSGIDSVEIHWPSGLKERWSDIPINRGLELHQGTGDSLRP